MKPDKLPVKRLAPDLSNSFDVYESYKLSLWYAAYLAILLVAMQSRPRTFNSEALTKMLVIAWAVGVVYLCFELRKSAAKQGVRPHNADYLQAVPMSLMAMFVGGCFAFFGGCAFLGLSSLVVGWPKTFW